MKVTCKINNLNDMSDKVVLDVLKAKIFRLDGKIDIDLGSEYVVYGIEFWENSPWYYLCVGIDDEYPKPYAADLFFVSENKLSTYWQLGFCTNYNGSQVASLVFGEWAADRRFYERLIDGEEVEVELFKKYKSLMDDEAK
ncbi:hypothetical protein A249_39375 [Pseudomonas syringae pv. actinidiae ICMP 18804]|nr:hypothetical protein A246_13641 [Pseudomonas syringae pv. actinidiae ICMP 19098]EPM69005.1 hypothetical protein A249_39375 [Pseudomonas syringae pv. actinidiae ICMP 18804]EPN14349.1 hypothetical protein A248_27107 [Pseudomonas syringae pv. actinidiae ICMP 19100]EPN34173.1 hypothetical protein A243_13834 [Pseudomonas syringae pv. actinidiae ICMP 18883]EPN38146.1 hypothetical protein A242_29188 [Pseudomonas syringae pv. actinidiae ICMP 19095]KTC49847.1 hypothetical protein AO250_14370 [Pseudo